MTQDTDPHPHPLKKKEQLGVAEQAGMAALSFKKSRASCSRFLMIDARGVRREYLTSGGQENTGGRTRVKSCVLPAALVLNCRCEILLFRSWISQEGLVLQLQVDHNAPGLLIHSAGRHVHTVVLRDGKSAASHPVIQTGRLARLPAEPSDPGGPDHISRRQDEASTRSRMEVGRRSPCAQTSTQKCLLKELPSLPRFTGAVELSRTKLLEHGELGEQGKNMPLNSLP
ncbi:hypothetical protein SKAU_G00176780 [Synaphobranchus kaupii]|uniref:Uncharacterized protein n=1 Tax=Synaphobranchus kaupii TaxID=118154 RepID=A0A9Q1FLU2_SYNKA|nr:hypothetical protein SKAU_G00176780 [Synaphobranchus kaupii]